MRNTIPVNVVVTDGVGDSYPGPLVDIELLCEGGTVHVEPIFLVQQPGPGWTVYTIPEFLAAFPGADTGGLPFHPGTLISCDGDTPWSYGVSNPFEDIFYTIDTCCGTEITDQVLALKQSLYPLTPGEPVPCGAEAVFMWLAIATESGGWDHSVFSVTLRSSDGLIEIGPTVIGGGIAPPTMQLKKKWPEDFIGMTIGGTLIVGNNVTPGPGEINVGAFDNGEIDIKVELYTAFEFSITDQKTFALPSTQCDDESESFSGSTSESSEGETPCAAGDPENFDDLNATAETPFAATINIVGGNAPFVYLPGSSNKPAWMTVSIVGSQIILGGTPAVGDVVSNFPLSIAWSACDGDASGFYQPNLNVTEIGFLFAQGSGDISDYPGEIESWYYGLRNRAGFVTSGADYLALIQARWDIAAQVNLASIDKNSPGGTFDDLVTNTNMDVQSVWPSRPESIEDIMIGLNSFDFFVPSLWAAATYNPTRDKIEITPGAGRLVSYGWFDNV